MKKTVLVSGLLLALAGALPAQAAVNNYNVTTIWFEPMTQPKDSIFKGSFTFDDVTHTVTNLKGLLSESMTGTNASNMIWLTLNNQLVTWHDNSLGGTFAATFKNSDKNTFYTGSGGDGWSPQAGVDVGGIYYGWPVKANNPANAYALIFVPDNPLSALTTNQLAKVAYADCNPGAMMMAACMTGTSVAGYGSVGTMDGYPKSQVITAVPEPETYAMLMAGLGLVGFIARRRRLPS